MALAFRLGPPVKFALICIAMMLSPWVFFLRPAGSPIVLALPLLVGAGAMLLLYRDWRDLWLLYLLAPVALYFPAMIVSDTLAHTLFNGCVLY